MIGFIAVGVVVIILLWLQKFRTTNVDDLQKVAYIKKAGEKETYLILELSHQEERFIKKKIKKYINNGDYEKYKKLVKIWNDKVEATDYGQLMSSDAWMYNLEEYDAITSFLSQKDPNLSMVMYSCWTLEDDCYIRVFNERLKSAKFNAEGLTKKYDELEYVTASETLPQNTVVLSDEISFKNKWIVKYYLREKVGD